MKTKFMCEFCLTTYQLYYEQKFVICPFCQRNMVQIQPSKSWIRNA